MSILLDLFAYGAIVGLAHSVHFYRRYREREHRAILLEASLAKARLNALQTQLRPHFLFNSLNAIVTLLRRDPRLAESTLMALSDLLRLTLSQSDKQEVTLREELQFVQSYVEIQQIRFGDKLHFEQNIQAAMLDCLVPSLLLQPLIENAIRHGIEPSDDAGSLRLTAQQENARLVITVEDDGVGMGAKGESASKPELEDSIADFPVGTVDNGRSSSALITASRVQCSASKSGSGIGLSNLRARLEALYGCSYKLELGPREPTGVALRIEIPFRPASGQI